MRAVDIIQGKRDGRELAEEEIRFFVNGYASGRIPDYQAAAFVMAVFFAGMTADETLALTHSMMHTGEILDLGDIEGPKVDKHSTGGVGDKTSLVLAPLAAACGVYVPMISGRGLSHSGGTLDKLEAIPGFRVSLSLAEFRSVLARSGLAIIGQTPEIAPADRKLYALRDVTATVDSPPLIAASIMSKKLAEGIDALVLDVKTGDGSFLPSIEESRDLAGAMVAIGRGMQKKVAALITDMGQPLGRAVGNSLEVAEAIETLKGRGPKDLESLSLELAARMLTLAEAATTPDTARARVREALGSGAGLAKLQETIELQGGDPRVCSDPTRLPRAAQQLSVGAEREGRVTAIACRQIGRAAMLLGAGRGTMAAIIDPAVGIVMHKKLGDPVVLDEPLASLHVNATTHLDEAAAMVRQAMTISDRPAKSRPLIQDVLE